MTHGGGVGVCADTTGGAGTRTGEAQDSGMGEVKEGARPSAAQCKSVQPFKPRNVRRIRPFAGRQQRRNDREEAQTAVWWRGGGACGRWRPVCGSVRENTAFCRCVSLHFTLVHGHIPGKRPQKAQGRRTAPPSTAVTTQQRHRAHPIAGACAAPHCCFHRHFMECCDECSRAQWRQRRRAGNPPNNPMLTGPAKDSRKALYPLLQWS